jgi:hypothetical protein
MTHGFKASAKGLAGQLSLLDGSDDARSAAFLSTPYGLVRQLLRSVPSLAGQLAIEPCAGNGAIIRHSWRAASELEQSEIDWRYAVELRDERDALASLARDVYTPCDTTQLVLCDRDVTLALTNLPWFDGVIPICEALWRMVPNAHVWGLCSTFFYLQTAKEARARWMHDHRPEHIYHVPHRVVFEGERGAYNQPVAWHHWLPGGQRGAGIWDMLLDDDGVEP